MFKFFVLLTSARVTTDSPAAMRRVRKLFWWVMAGCVITVVALIGVDIVQVQNAKALTGGVNVWGAGKIGANQSLGGFALLAVLPLFLAAYAFLGWLYFGFIGWVASAK